MACANVNSATLSKGWRPLFIRPLSDPLSTGLELFFAAVSFRRQGDQAPAPTSVVVGVILDAPLAVMRVESGTRESVAWLARIGAREAGRRGLSASWRRLAQDGRRPDAAAQGTSRGERGF
jgi:hypothetical protein